jgi:hypothetical protein
MLIAIRGCVGAIHSALNSGPTPEGLQTLSQYNALRNTPKDDYPNAHAALGSTLSISWLNTNGQAYVVYINGARRVVLNGDQVTVTGTVVFDRRYKCLALRVEGEGSPGKLAPMYFPLSQPTPASFWDCTPDE